MKDEILRVLREHPNGLRQRYVASEIGCWTASPILVASLWELEQAGKIVSILHRDIGNMESFYIWKISS